MGLVTIDGKILRKMMICGANELTRNSRVLDALNVFPVPDGDTGVNMAHTVQAAAREAAKLNTPNIYDVAKAASNGALRGARGNSGVILSQLFRGFAKGLEGKSVANDKELANALAESAKMAYRAVMKPKEGTILTIARALGDYAQEAEGTDLEQSLQFVIKGANTVLDETPSMLPELKQAGVVDAGGKGLLHFYEGALAGMTFVGEPVLETQSGDAGASNLVPAALSDANIKFAYCTEFLIEAEKPITEKQSASLQDFLSANGDSVVVVGDEGVVKVHVHTNHPGKVMERAIGIGQLTNIKIDNMRYQHTNLLEFSTSQAPQLLPPVPQGPPKEIGFVAVVAGTGLRDVFVDLGADSIIEGGQTMNPSADDIAQAIGRVNAKHVIVLPNNKNIILAAEQAALLTDKKVHVVPTRFIPQGVACLLNFMDSNSLEENLASMNDIISGIQTGQVTFAARDTVVNGKDVQEGDILCLYNGEIISTGKDLQESAKSLADYMLAKGGDVFSVYYGEGISEAQATKLCDTIQANNPSIEILPYDGKQPLYYYIFSVE